MTISMLKSFLLWSALLNYGVLLFGFLCFVVAQDAIYRIHSRWFGLGRERFAAIAYLLLGLYKCGIWLLFLVPYFALLLVFGSGA